MPNESRTKQLLDVAFAMALMTIAGTTGKPFFVSSGQTVALGGVSASANQTGRGTKPEEALATIDYAVGLCVADRGDAIIVFNHTETVTAAAALAIDIAGVSVIGVGRGSKQPKIDLTTIASATVTITADNCQLVNFQIEASFADIVSEIVVSGKDCRIAQCRFLEPTTDENALINILTGAANSADGLVVENCEFRGLDAANTIGISCPNAQARTVFENNKFLGVFETGAIKAVGVLAQVFARNNTINNTSGDADECISIADTSTGAVVGNDMGNSLAANATTNMNCGTTMTMCRNFSTDKGDVQGVLDPVAT